MQEAEDQAAELNAQLQDRVDELMEKLSKYSAPMLNIEELGQGEDGIPFEVFAKPIAEQPTTAGVEPKPQAKPVFDNTCRIQCTTCSPAFACATPKSR